MKRILWIALLSALFLAGCGTGGDRSGNGLVSVIVTDDLSQDYKEVWVTLYQVTLQSEVEGAEDHALFKDPAGKVVNLSTLNGIGELLSVNELPAGHYTRFKIKLAKDITLVKNDDAGTTELRKFRTHHEDSASFTQIKLNGDLTIEAGAVTAFALDFDLKNFDFNEAGEVVPHVLFVKEWRHQIHKNMAEVEGTITELGDNSFKLQTEHNTEVTVEYNPDTVILRGRKFKALSELAVGDRIEAKGSYNPDTLTLTALSIRIEHQKRDNKGDDDDDNSDSEADEVKGTITAIVKDETAKTTTITLDVTKSDFVPDSNTLSVVIDDEKTVFTRGDLSLLAVGQEIEVEGAMNDDGTAFIATRVEIEGSHRCSDSDDSEHEYVEVYGTVKSITDGIATIEVKKVEHISDTLDTEISVDLSKVFIANGEAADVVVGAAVKVKGSYENDTFDANVLIIKPAIVNSDDDHDDMPSDDNPGLEHCETAVVIDATIFKVEGSSLDLNVTRSPPCAVFAATIPNLTVDLSSLTLGNGTTSADYVENVHVRLVGAWDTNSKQLVFTRITPIPTV